jgi:hypothetical protein
MLQVLSFILIQQVIVVLLIIPLFVLLPSVQCVGTGSHRPNGFPDTQADVVDASEYSDGKALPVEGKMESDTSDALECSPLQNQENENLIIAIDVIDSDYKDHITQNGPAKLDLHQILVCL